MTVFAVIAPTEDPRLKAKVVELYPNAHYEIAPGQLLVSDKGVTSQQVAEKIGVDGQVGKLLVMTVGTSYGYHDKPLWEWLKVNSE